MNQNTSSDEDRQIFSGFTERLEPGYPLSDIPVSQQQIDLLKNILASSLQESRPTQVQDLEARTRVHRGSVSLFVGGDLKAKLMAAAALGHELNLDVYRIELSQVVSKYIGETEKNLGHIFAAAAKIDFVLLFVELDSVFGKRSEVKDVNDRYANMETSYLLQQIETYEGLVILSAQNTGRLSESLLRQVDFVVDFPDQDSLPNSR